MISLDRARRYAELPPAVFRSRWAALPTESARDEAIRLRCRVDRGLMCRYFFGGVFNLPWSPVHLEFLARPKLGWRERTRQLQRADLAPRGMSKTTLENYADLLHDTVYGIEVCTLIYSTTFPDSQRMVKALHDILAKPETNPAFHRVFGPFRVEGTQTEFAAYCPNGEPLGSQFAAKSFGGSGRGHLYRNQRPSKITMDDIVHPQHVYSARQRDDDWRFLQNDILKSGAPCTIFRMLNTVQHDDDTTSRAQRDPAWTCRRWSALIAWPKRMALWEECRLRWADLANTGTVERIVDGQPIQLPARVVAAEDFYRAHKAEMDEGAEVLWPERRPLFVLMVAFWTNAASFYAEDQNTPRDPERQVFDVSRFRRFRLEGRTIHIPEVRAESGAVIVPARTVSLADCDLACWLDPSLGKTSSDYPALARVARERRTGQRFVLRCTLTKGPPSSQRSRVWAEFDGDPRGKWGTDATGLGALFEEGFTREKDERRKGGRVWNLDMKGYTNSEDKNGQIARLEPDTLNGMIQFADDLPQEVINQFRDAPHGSHDDGPNAIERADWLLTSGDMPLVESRGRG